MMDIVIVHRGDYVAFYGNGELIFFRESTDLVDAFDNFQYMHINTVTHKSLSEKGYDRCDSGEYPEKLSDFDKDDFE